MIVCDRSIIRLNYRRMRRGGGGGRGNCAPPPQFFPMHLIRAKMLAVFGQFHSFFFGGGGVGELLVEIFCPTVTWRSSCTGEKVHESPRAGGDSGMDS